MPDNTDLQGVSTPPNGGQVLDIANPEANDSTVSQTAAPSNPVQTPQGPIQGQTPNTNANQNQPNQPGKQLNLSKTPGRTQPTVSAIPSIHPAVQKASTAYDVAEALAGGPRFKYTVDNTGTLQRTPIPVSNAHLALAIAMQAIGGGLSGLANGQGPNGRARAAAVGFQQGQQNVQQQDQKARQQAQEDFARKAQLTEMNMRLYNNARTIGKMDADAADSYIGQYKDLADRLQTEFPGYIKAAGVSYKDLAKYNVTADTAIPYKRVPRLDNDGHQVEINGRPQWDIDYMILDPSFKTTGLLTPEDTTTLTAWGQPGMDNPNIKDAPLAAALALSKKSMATQLNIAQQAFENIFDTVDEANQKGQGVSPDLTTDGTLTAPTIDAQAIQGIADNTADKYAKTVQDIVAPDNFKALIHGIINQESGGNPMAVSSTGATGVMQLTKDTAQQMGVTDRTDPTQNINGGIKYFSQLLAQYKDPKKALAAYYSGPTSINANGQIVDTLKHTAKATQKYVDDVSNHVGLNAITPSDIEEKKHPSPTDYANEHPTFASDVEKFMGAYNSLPPSSEGQVGAALAHLRSSGQADAANNVAAYINQYGSNTIKLHDDYVTTQAEQRKQDVLTNAAEAKAASKKALDQQNANVMAKLVQGPDDFNWDESLQNLPEKQMEAALKQRGVQIPSNFSDLYSIAKYQDDPSNYAPRTWMTGNPYEMDKQSALSYIHKFINPDYDEKTYNALSTTARQLYNPDSRINRNIQAIGTVTNHMELLRQAAHEVASGEPLNGQFPALNKLAGEFQTQIGQSPYLTLQALTRRVNGEISNVAGGGFAPHAEDVEQTMNNMTAANVEQQIDSLIKTYTGIMQGRLEPVNNQIKALTGKDIQTISPETTALFQRYGYDTPWAPVQKSVQNTQNPQERPVTVNGHIIGYTTDGKTLSRVAQ